MSRVSEVLLLSVELHLLFMHHILKQKLRIRETPIVTACAAQASLAVIGNIALPSGRNKEKIISFTFTGDEFTRSHPVAPRLPSRNVRNVFPSLSQSAPIELMYCGV